jgi:tRNA nucleotidyltransferase (CCA-adding enzyme)
MYQEAQKICEAVRDAGGRAFLVGGSVRDRLLGIESKDLDLEVYSVEPSRLRALLEEIAPVNTVGESFAIYKLAFYRSIKSQSNSKSVTATSKSQSERFEIDVSIPRRESKSGRGHRGFTIEGDPLMSIEEAARRRDFTINAILYDPITGETLDPYGGVEDLNSRVLRAVARDTFIDDSLRVLRAVQFAARFEMTVDPQTIELCRSIDLSDLPHERIWGEIEKLLLLPKRPSIGLDIALEIGVLDKLFPQLCALTSEQNHTQDRNEPDAFTRTKRRLDGASGLTFDLPKEQRTTVMLAALCLDLCKPVRVPLTEDMRRRAFIEQENLKEIVSLLDALGVYTISGYDVRSQVLSIASERSWPEEFYKEKERVTNGDFRRLSRRVDIDLLYRISKADATARNMTTEGPEWFIAKARELGVEHGPPDQILMGRHLIEAGFAPGSRMGEILRQVYELQLDDKVTNIEEALTVARKLN